MSNQHTLTVPDTATPEETAAIAAAIGAHLSDQQQADDKPSTDDRIDSWQFTGRMNALNNQATRVPESAPEDPWTAANRLDQF